VRLGSHPEAGVCLACAHYLHLQARGREDARRRSLPARAREQLHAARQVVITRGWHRTRSSAGRCVGSAGTCPDLERGLLTTAPAR
jgi:hypothetical protein